MTFPASGQSPEPPSPGWWLAANGHWYPPGVSMPAAPPPPVGTGPTVPPRFAPTGGPGAAGPGVPPSDFGTSGHDAPPAWQRTSVVVAIAAVLIVGSTFYALARSAPSPAAPALAAGVTIPPATGSPSSTTPSSPTGPLALAQDVGFQPGDLAQGWTAVPHTGAAMSSPGSPGACSPVSGAPWLANVSSADYQSPSGWTAYSQVVVMPDAAHAQAALQAIDAPGYASACFQPAWDQWAQQAIASANAQAPCHLSFDGSSVGPVPTQSLPSAVPGAAGVEYKAQVTCPSEGSSTVTRDEISAVVGNLFIQVQFLGTGTPPTLSESTSLAAVANRARTEASGH